MLLLLLLATAWLSVAVFLGYHVYLISSATTTSEWHKRRRGRVAHPESTQERSQKKAPPWRNILIRIITCGCLWKRADENHPVSSPYDKGFWLNVSDALMPKVGSVKSD